MHRRSYFARSGNRCHASRLCWADPCSDCPGIVRTRMPWPDHSIEAHPTNGIQQDDDAVCSRYGDHLVRAPKISRVRRREIARYGKGRNAIESLGESGEPSGTARRFDRQDSGGSFRGNGTGELRTLKLHFLRSGPLRLQSSLFETHLPVVIRWYPAPPTAPAPLEAASSALRGAR